MFIINARLYTFDRKNTVIENGYIHLQQGKILSLGKLEELQSEKAILSEEEVFDAAGLSLYPGFVDAHTHLGLFGDSLTFEGDDGNEDTDPITPQLRAIDGINPFDRCFEEARMRGITAAASSPGSANPCGGEIAALKTNGRRVDDMLIKKCGIKFALECIEVRRFFGSNRETGCGQASSFNEISACYAVHVGYPFSKVSIIIHEFEPECDPFAIHFCVTNPTEKFILFPLVFGPLFWYNSFIQTKGVKSNGRKT